MGRQNIMQQMQALSSRTAYVPNFIICKLFCLVLLNTVAMPVGCYNSLLHLVTDY
jgi:hypothetical protein